MKRSASSAIGEVNILRRRLKYIREQLVHIKVADLSSSFVLDDIEEVLGGMKDDWLEVRYRKP